MTPEEHASKEEHTSTMDDTSTVDDTTTEDDTSSEDDTGTVTEFVPPRLKELANRVVTILRNCNETISVVESTPGGLLSAALLSVPGASAFYKGGVMLSSQELRRQFAGKGMHEGRWLDDIDEIAHIVRDTLETTYTIAEIGTAGPTGGSSLSETPGHFRVALAEHKETWSNGYETGTSQRERNVLIFAEQALRFFLALKDPRTE